MKKDCVDELMNLSGKYFEFHRRMQYEEAREAYSAMEVQGEKIRAMLAEKALNPEPPTWDGAGRTSSASYKDGKLHVRPAEEGTQPDNRKTRANALLQAAHDFWKSELKSGMHGAVKWLTGDDGSLVIFTRGEYLSTLMRNVGEFEDQTHLFKEETPAEDPDNAPNDNLQIALNKLIARAAAEPEFSEDESFVADGLLQYDFEMLDANGSVYGCTLSQILDLIKRYGGSYGRFTARPGELFDESTTLKKFDLEKICESLPARAAMYLRRSVGNVHNKVCNYGGFAEGGVVKGGKIDTDEIPAIVRKPFLHGEYMVKGDQPPMSIYPNLDFIVKGKQLPNGDKRNIKVSTRQNVAVDQDYYWIEDMAICPRGVKVQLKGQGGVALYMNYDGDPYWVGWAPLPKNREV